MRECRMNHVVKTIRGFRTKNEDYSLAVDGDSFYALADGIGGAPFGDVMARIACARAYEAWKESGKEGASCLERLSRAIGCADEACSRVSGWLGGQGSGTTLLIASYEQGRMHIASVGDSAAFALKDGKLIRLTGIGRRSRNDKALEEALGYDLNPKPNYWVGDKDACDAYLLCTDGMWDDISDEGIEVVASRFMTEWKKGTPDEILDAMMHLSMGRDNATAILLTSRPKENVER